MKPKLPIDDMTDEEFRKFKERYLNAERFNDDTLEAINKLFAVGSSSTGTICCDEDHGHNYGCVRFYHPTVGVVNRLVEEIKAYRTAMEDIRKKLLK